MGLSERFLILPAEAWPLDLQIPNLNYQASLCKSQFSLDIEALNSHFNPTNTNTSSPQPRRRHSNRRRYNHLRRPTLRSRNGKSIQAHKQTRQRGLVLRRRPRPRMGSPSRSTTRPDSKHGELPRITERAFRMFPNLCHGPSRI